VVASFLSQRDRELHNKRPKLAAAENELVQHTEELDTKTEEGRELAQRLEEEHAGLAAAQEERDALAERIEQDNIAQLRTELERVEKRLRERRGCVWLTGVVGGLCVGGVWIDELID
jgi:uncharacterized protein involved in exopolysaccharide biosynthesis